MSSREEQLKAFGRLLDIMDDLREKCPWDRKQTFDSLRQNTIEETYELATAISRHDMNEICKELGDVLLHVVFYAKMGSETEDFDIADVCNRLCDKLIFRHPHVYGEAAAQNAEEVSHLWEQVKLKEKGGNKTVLGGIPDSLPSLVKAYRIQDHNGQQRTKQRRYHIQINTYKQSSRMMERPIKEVMTELLGVIG